ncbi:unnamed protein product [Ixodes pacificus]
MTVDGIARTLSLSVGTAHKIVHDDLGYSKVSSRWVPKMLTAKHKQRREGDEFLKKMVPSDKTWVWHYEPEFKRQSMEWKHAGSPVKKNSSPSGPLGR